MPTNAHRAIATDALEMEGRVRGVSLQKRKLFVR